MRRVVVILDRKRRPLRCDICGEDKTGVVMVVDQAGRRVVCPDCALRASPSFWNREEPHEADEPEDRTG